MPIIDHWEERDIFTEATENIVSLYNKITSPHAPVSPNDVQFKTVSPQDSDQWKSLSIVIQGERAYDNTYSLDASHTFTNKIGPYLKTQEGGWEVDKEGNRTGELQSSFSAPLGDNPFGLVQAFADLGHADIERIASEVNQLQSQKGGVSM